MSGSTPNNQAICIACRRDSWDFDPGFVPVFCKYCKAITCRDCLTACSRQRSVAEYMAIDRRRRQQTLCERNHVEQRSYAWRARVEAFLVCLRPSGMDGKDNAGMSADSATATSEALWQRQMAQQALAGNLDITDLADPSSLPTLLRLIKIAELQRTVCATLVTIAKNAGQSPLPSGISWACDLQPLLEFEEPVDMALDTARRAAAEEIMGWAHRVDSANTETRLPPAADGKFHWFNCIKCGGANEIARGDAHPFTWLIKSRRPNRQRHHMERHRGKDCHGSLATSQPQEMSSHAGLRDIRDPQIPSCGRARHNQDVYIKPELLYECETEDVCAVGKDRETTLQRRNLPMPSARAAAQWFRKQQKRLVYYEAESCTNVDCGERKEVLDSSLRSPAAGVSRLAATPMPMPTVLHVRRTHAKLSTDKRCTAVTGTMPLRVKHPGRDVTKISYGE